MSYDYQAMRHTVFTEAGVANLLKARDAVDRTVRAAGAVRPAIFMPRRAVRIFLEVESVRVERLQDISESDCWAEGIEPVVDQFSAESQFAMAKRLNACFEDAKPVYAQLWESINGAGSWDANPWVWVVVFSRLSNGD